MQTQEDNSVEFDKLLEDSKSLNIHIPSYVRKEHITLYKFVYLQVKNDPEASSLSANNRTKMIINLMNMYIEKIIKEAKVLDEKKNVEG